MEDDELQESLISIAFRHKRSNSGAYRKGLWEVDIVLVEQLFTLWRELERLNPRRNLHAPRRTCQ